MDARPCQAAAEDEEPADPADDILSRMQVSRSKLSFAPAATNPAAQRIGAAVPFPGAAMNEAQRAEEEAAALAKAAAEAERKVRPRLLLTEAAHDCNAIHNRGRRKRKHAQEISRRRCVARRCVSAFQVPFRC